MSTVRNLRLVDADTGELVDRMPECPECSRKDDEIAGLERDIRGWTLRNAELKRDRDYDARHHELWPVAEQLFDVWRRVCHHERSRFTVDRFEEARPLVAKYGVVTCERAIAGAAFDPHTTTRRNGSTKRYDDWDLIFRNAGKVEEFANRAPRDWQPTLVEEQ